MATTYKPKNILITGAAGFIASHVCNRLVHNYLDYKIIALDKLDYCSNLKNLIPSHSSSNFKFIKGDICNAAIVNHILLSESIDTIMHFAAQTHVDNSFGNSFEFTQNNIYGTHVLLEACKVIGAQVKRFIHVSTDEVYGETDEDALVGKHEASQLLPTNPYSASKAGAEMLVMAYGRSYGLPVITTRGNNVYGPNQFPEKLIPKFLLLAMKEEALPIHGDGSNVRSYLYCEDVAEAFEVILHRGHVGHVYNIGTKKERRVIDVARDICSLFSLDPDTHIMFVENRPFNDQRYYLEDEKLNSLGWFERTTWEEGLRKTMDWYLKNPDWWGDVSGALLPHPRMLTTLRVEKNDVHDMMSGVFSSLTLNNSNHNRTVISVPRKNETTQNKTSLKFLIYGGSGWIGGLLGNICENQGIPFEYGKGSLEDRSQILVDIQTIKPTHVFNASGVSGALNVEWCNAHKTETISVIVVGVLTLADVCRYHGLPMINYAFDGNFEDIIDFSDSFYSKTQAKVEEFLKAYENVCSIKVQLPVSSDLSNPYNFITKMTRSNKVPNIPINITVLDELLPISIEMAKRNCKGSWTLTNPGTVTCNEVLEMYKLYIDHSFEWVNFTVEQHPQLPSQTIKEMNASLLSKEFPELLLIKDSLIKNVFEPKKKSFVH